MFVIIQLIIIIIVNKKMNQNYKYQEKFLLKLISPNKKREVIVPTDQQPLNLLLYRYILISI